MSDDNKLHVSEEQERALLKRYKVETEQMYIKAFEGIL